MSMKFDKLHRSRNAIVKADEQHERERLLRKGLAAQGRHIGGRYTLPGCGDMTISDERKLTLAREALDEVIKRFDLVVRGDDAVARLLGEAEVVAAIVEQIEERRL